MLVSRRLAIALVRNRPSTATRAHITGTMSTMASDPRGQLSPPGPVERAIRAKLTELLQPSALDIANDSHKHRHHAPMQAVGGGNGETHFTVQVVSEVFQGKNTMQRHRMIYAALSEELAAGLHALSLKTKTPAEVQSVST